MLSECFISNYIIFTNISITLDRTYTINISAYTLNVIFKARLINVQVKILYVPITLNILLIYIMEIKFGFIKNI